MTPEEIISDEEIEKVHSNANFGDTPKRWVVNSSLLKIHFGYSTGYTAYKILREHDLIKVKWLKSKQKILVNEKGKKYLRAVFGPKLNGMIKFAMETIDNDRT